MEFCYEMTRELDYHNAVTFEHRIKAVAEPVLQKNRVTNTLHCLYFAAADQPEKIEFHMCYFNDGFDGIRLVKLSSQNGMSYSAHCEVTRDFIKNVIKGDFSSVVTDPMGRSGIELDPLMQEFYWLVIGRGLTPIFMMDFESSSYSYGQGNVRVIIDSNRRISFEIADYLNPNHSSTAYSDDNKVRIQWESYLPDMIKSAIDGLECRTSSYLDIVALLEKRVLTA